MRIALLNGGVFGSTGAILSGILHAASDAGEKMEFFCASPVTVSNRRRQPDFPYYAVGGYRSRQLSVLLARLTGASGCFSVVPTLRYLSRMKKFDPDLIHIHTLHESWLNLPLFFRWLKGCGKPVIWTLHDCWAFTGHCPHYEAEGCEGWRTGCGRCPRWREYPAASFDNSKQCWRRKRKWFTGVPDLTVVTPSRWLADQVRQSFLGEYPRAVVNNGVDLRVFRPSAGDCRERYGVREKYLVLGVAFGWSDRKGLDVFRELAGRLPEDYRIVLVGVDPGTAQSLPERILALERTADRAELAALYSAADVFVNPTREDTFPTVNLEALACGTPVVTFAAGGSAEIPDESCGFAVSPGDVNALEERIRRTCEEAPFSREACLARGRQFDRDEKFRSYLELYHQCYDRSATS